MAIENAKPWSKWFWASFQGTEHASVAFLGGLGKYAPSLIFCLYLALGSCPYAKSPYREGERCGMLTPLLAVPLFLNSALLSAISFVSQINMHVTILPSFHIQSFKIHEAGNPYIYDRMDALFSP